MPDWLEQENKRAEDNLAQGTTENAEAPKMVMVKSKRAKKPSRKTRGIFVQDPIWSKYEKTVFKMKKVKSAPELAEEALQYIIDKYGKGSEK